MRHLRGASNVANQTETACNGRATSLRRTICSRTSYGKSGKLPPQKLRLGQSEAGRLHFHLDNSYRGSLGDFGQARRVEVMLPPKQSEDPLEFRGLLAIEESAWKAAGFTLITEKNSHARYH